MENYIHLVKIHIFTKIHQILYLSIIGGHFSNISIHAQFAVDQLIVLHAVSVSVSGCAAAHACWLTRSCW